MAGTAKNKINLSDVALAAGVSRAAAGKVLNGGVGAIRVGAAARRRIEEAARKLNYHTNMAAAMLAGRESELIGVMADSQTPFRNARLLQEIEQMAFRKHYRLMVSFTHDNVSDMRENYNAMQRYGVAGIICLAHDYPQFRNEIAALFRDTTDVVFMEKPDFAASAWVGTDPFDAISQLFADLKTANRSRIALAYGNPVYKSEAVLLDTYRRALAANNIAFDPALLCRYPDDCSALERCEYLIENFLRRGQCDALFVDDATYAVCLQCKLQYAGWRMPDELLIFGGNNDPLFRHAAPEINSLDPCYSAIAAALLDALLQHGEKCETVIKTTYHNS